MCATMGGWDRANTGGSATCVLIGSVLNAERGPTSMTRITAGEMLAQAADLHYDWSVRVADRVPVNPDDRNPNEDDESDYNEHHHTVSAPANVDDQLNERLAALCEQRHRDVGGR